MNHTNSVSTPMNLSFFNDKPIASLHAGARHSIVHLQNGQVYAFGYQNCCGMESSNHVLVPTLVSLPNDALAECIVCSSFCTLVCTTNKQWYAFGNASEQSKPAYDKSVTSIASRIDDVFPISPTSKKQVQVKTLLATRYAFFLLSIDNELFVIGYGGNGEMALGHTNDVSSWTYHSLVEHGKIANIQAGWYNFFILQK